MHSRLLRIFCLMACLPLLWGCSFDPLAMVRQNVVQEEETQEQEGPGEGGETPAPPAPAEPLFAFSAERLAFPIEGGSQEVKVQLYCTNGHYTLLAAGLSRYVFFLNWGPEGTPPPLDKGMQSMEYHEQKEHDTILVCGKGAAETAGESFALNLQAGNRVAGPSIAQTSLRGPVRVRKFRCSASAPPHKHRKSQLIFDAVHAAPLAF